MTEVSGSAACGNRNLRVAGGTNCAKPAGHDGYHQDTAGFFWWPGDDDPAAPVRRLVFNAQAWRRAGGDMGETSQFWEVATLLNEYDDDGDVLADVRWPDGHITTGHITSLMREVPDA